MLIFLPRKYIELSYPATQLDKTLLKSIKIMFAISVPMLFIAMAIYSGIKGIYIIDFPYTGLSLNVYFVISALIIIPFYVWNLLKPINIPIVSTVKDFFSSIKAKNIAMLIIIFALIHIIQRYFSDSSNPVPLAGMLVGRLLIPAVQAPIAFMVSNFMYYGFIIIFLCIFWKDVVKEYAKYGYSFFIIIILGTVMFFNTESRHLLSFVPFLFFPAIEALKNYFAIKSAIVFLVASLLLSRFWFKINVDGIEEAFIFVSHNDYTQFPAQRYFMSQGPWMSYPMYLVFSCLFVVSFIVIYLWIKKTSKLLLANEK
jgi:hypothetical protein